MRSSCLLAAGFVLAGCSSTEDPGPFLGPATPVSTSLPAPVGPAGRCEAPALVALDAPVAAASACALTLDGAGGKPGLAASGAGLVVALPGGAQRLEVDEGGCPSALAGELLVVEGALGPVAQGDALWVARGAGVELFDGDAALASCDLAGVRSLAVAGSKAWAATGRGVIPVQFSGDACFETDPWPLGGAPVALGLSRDDGLWVVAVDAGCGAPVLRRHLESSDIDTEALGGGLFLATLGLCSVSSLVEIDGKLILVDSTCRQVVAIDAAQGLPIWRWSSTGTPVGAAPGASGALTVSLLSGGKLGFASLPL